MGKVVKAVVGIVGIASIFIPGVGVAISAALTSIGVGAVAAATIAGVITTGLIVNGISFGVSTITGVLGLGPKPPKESGASATRLRANLDPRANRKIVFGRTAANTDVQYQEYTGASQDTLNTILTLASHALHSIDEIWFDEKLAWSSTSGIGSSFTGFLAVTTRLEGTAANAFTITGSTSWTASASRMVGNSYVWLRYTLSGEGSPFASAISSRITVRARGAKLYDPRLDSTVGGSGSHRADDQTTWAWVSDDVGRNPALQLLWYLLGWRIQNPSTSEWKLAVGLGLPVDRIDIPSFIAAANICDEPVALAAGGTEPRYRGDGVFGEGDDPSVVFENLCAAMNAVLRDNGGKLALEILRNDLGTPVVDLTAADVIGNFAWLQTPPIDQNFNIVRGQYIDASDASLYQPVDYPDVTLPSPDGIDRSKTFSFGMVQSASQAQRLAKTYLQRAQYPGTFSADFLASAWRCQVGSVVRLTFPALGFSNKLFRVVEHSIRLDGTCPMVLREENAAIYAWSASEAPAVVAAAPISYNPLNDPIRTSLADALALAAARGKVWTKATMPTLAESNPGDTWIAPDGQFYDRVESGGILLDGFAITLGGFRPQLAWTLSNSQPLLATITQANAAAAQAAVANLELANIASDNLLSKGEKPQVILDVAAINNEQAGIDAQATAYSITTEKTAYDNAVTALASYLAGLTTPTLWNNTSGDTTIVGSTFRTNFANVYSARQALLNKIAAVAGTLAGWSGISGAGKPEDNADVTSAVQGLALVEINADYTGAVTASLPREVGYKLVRNGVDVTTSATWSVAVVSGTISATIGSSTGILSLDLSGGVLNDAVLTVTAVYGTTTRTFTVKVSKLLAPAPTSGSGGSGSGGSASGTINGSSPGTTMTAVGPELTVTTGSGGAVSLNASYNFDTASGTGTNFGLNAQWYRWNGSAYVALGSAVGATSPYIKITGEPGEPGYGECSYSATGLGASTSQKFQLFANNVGTSTTIARRVYGTCSAVAS